MEAALNGPSGRTPLGPTPLTIGRMQDNQVVLDNPKTSAHHAEIRPEGQGYTIVDLSSTNGTYVNEQQLQPNVPRALNAGDVIRIGDISFTYEATGVSEIPPTIYAPPSAASSPGYAPTVAVPPPSFAQRSDQPPPPPPYAAYPPVGQASYPPPPQQPYPPPPPQPAYGTPAYMPPAPGYMAPVPGAPRNRRTLWIVLSVVGGALLLLCIACSVVYAVTRSTPTKTLTAFCNDLKSNDYQSAYGELSSRAQSQESEADFEARLRSAFASAGGLTDCTVGSVNEGSSTANGRIFWAFPAGSVPVDATLVDESGTWTIDTLTVRR